MMRCALFIAAALAAILAAAFAGFVVTLIVTLPNPGSVIIVLPIACAALGFAARAAGGRLLARLAPAPFGE